MTAYTGRGRGGCHGLAPDPLHGMNPHVAVVPRNAWWVGRMVHLLAVAQCQCPRKIRVAVGTLAEGPIICGVCGADFEITDPDA